jgi:acetylornithine deacetylase
VPAESLAPGASVRDRLIAAVDEAFDEQLATTAAVVAEPSLMGKEAGAQTLMADLMDRIDLDVDRWSIAESDLTGLTGAGTPLVDYADSWNVVGTRRGSGAGRSLILNGHIDVVPTGPEGRWTAPPFEPRIEDGWLYGRGAGDMKAGLVAAVYALDAFRRAQLRPLGDVFVESVVEEECSGNGSLACVARGYTADAAVFPEPTQHTTVTSAVGLIWFQLKVTGDPQHASRADRTPNAIEKAFELYRELQKLEAGWNERKHEHAGFERHNHPVNVLLGMIRGGDWPSSTPAWCTMDLRVGHFPGVEPTTVRAEVEACIGDAAEVVWHGHFGGGYELVGGDDLVKALTAAHESVFRGPLHQIAASGSSDARVLGAHGIPSVLYGPTARNIHGYDEAVELESVRQITRSLAVFIADWCGAEEV